MFPHPDPGALPGLQCPTNLTLEVNSSTSYNVTLAEYITADNGTTLSYSPGPVLMVGPKTVGKLVVRVTAADMFGFERQCAFVVDVKRECFCLLLDVCN